MIDDTWVLIAGTALYVAVLPFAAMEGIIDNEGVQNLERSVELPARLHWIVFAPVVARLTKTTGLPSGPGSAYRTLRRGGYPTRWQDVGSLLIGLSPTGRRRRRILIV